MNLPLELVDKILQYDGRIKYKKGEFINVIHSADSRYFILEKVITKKQNTIKLANGCLKMVMTETQLNAREFTEN